ncbi:hypothetical protein EDD16DRAFT_1726166 [Pisolithus croceorrhizus]|nr:hypothetical protein EDD16DRAFT_1726166 [Pisolithus croceorrhizus]
MNVRNVVVLGECGVGKSSIINMISGAQTTKTSSNVLGESPVSCRVVVMESGLRVNFWEMKGLPGDVGTAPTRLLRDLKTIVRRLLVFLSIDLLLFCIRAGSVTSAFVQGYQAIYVDVCARKVPIALVINGLEGSSGLDMHGWWAKNKDRLFNRGLAFDIHACVTTLSSDEDPSIREQIKTSQRRLRKLVDLPDYFGLPNHLNESESSISRPPPSGASISFYELSPDDVVVFLVGRTGCGKSSVKRFMVLRSVPMFTQHEAGVSHELDPKPKHINTFKYQHPDGNRRIVLVDTPGFTDPDRDLADDRIRAEITGWLEEACKRDVVVRHILYLYTPAYGPKSLLLRPFWNVYGCTMYSHLTLVETMAGCADSRSQSGSVKAVNNAMTRGGARAVVYEDTKESARSILQHVTNDPRVVARVQLKTVTSDIPGGFMKFSTRRKAATRLQKLVGEHLELLDRARDKSADNAGLHSLQGQLQRQRSEIKQIMDQIGLNPSLVRRITGWLDAVRKG